MKIHLSILFLVLITSISKAQERFLIQETDSIDIYETYLSNTSQGNIFPSFYKNGLIYVSDFNAKQHNLYFSNLASEALKISLRGRFKFGSATIYGSEIYFTGETKYFKSVIYKGIIENFKVSKIGKTEFCNPNFNYSDPFISEDGQQLILISDEKNAFHIKEFVKNNDHKWEEKSVPYISNPNFDILNPTIYNENTIYFSTNIYKGKITGVNYSTNEKGEIVVNHVNREEGVFNIYKLERKDGRWGIPKKVNELSSESDDMGVIFDSEKSGYLTSYRYNSNDNIYYFILK